jgi:WD40 repeat protein
MILVRVLVGGTCGWVCRRWHAVCAGAPAKKQAWQWRWAGYAHGEVPDVWPATGQGTTCAPATCLTRSSLDRSLYFGLEDGNIVRWSLPGKDGFVKGHGDCVNAIVAGKDGAVYSASDDRTILVWSANGGSHLQTLEGHTSAVVCLALGVDGTLYSGSIDNTVRVWAGRDGPLRLIRTLEGHTSAVRSLALGTDGKLCSGSCDHTIRVWSTTDGSYLETLTRHTGEVMAVAVAADGTLFSGSYDGTIRMWSGLCNSAKRTVQVLRTNSPVWAIAIGVGNTVFFGDDKHRVGVWNAGSVSSRMRILYTFTSDVRAMAIDQYGHLSAVCDDDSNVYDL